MDVPTRSLGNVCREVEAPRLAVSATRRLCRCAVWEKRDTRSFAECTFGDLSAGKVTKGETRNLVKGHKAKKNKENQEKTAQFVSLNMFFFQYQPFACNNSFCLLYTLSFFVFSSPNMHVIYL